VPYGTLSELRPVPLRVTKYQRYLPKVFAMLQEGSGASPIAAYLDNVATEETGLNGNPKHSRQVAELLLDWKTGIYRIR
jgi:hypothetical protein